MEKNKQSRDQLFATLGTPSDFVFDEKVASVFEDMINRSVPGYGTILSMIGVLAARYAQAGTNLYDLGCSLGGASYAMAREVSADGCRIHAIDSSPAMIERLEAKLASQSAEGMAGVESHCEDILDSEITNASVVVLNFTLQFIPQQQRQDLLKKIYEGLNEGGILIVSEKIVVPDPSLNELLIELYHNFKENMGYSKLEISQKRTALENVLIPETLEQHKSRLAECGFRASEVWFQCFNFASMVAFK